MTQGINTVFELEGSKGGITVEVAVTEQFDTLRNISDLTVSLQVKSSQYSNYTYYPTGSMTVDGVKLVEMSSVVPSHHVEITARNTYFPVEKWNDGYTGSPWTINGIIHNTDGSKTVSLVLEMKGYTGSGGGGSGWSVAVTKDIQLTHIPRASTIAATDANIEAVSMLAVTRRSAEYTHSIAWRFGSLSGYLDEDGSVLDTEKRLTVTSIPFLLPVEFYAEIPNAKEGNCVLTCKTYWGETVVGTTQQYTFTVTAAQSLCGPAVAGSVRDINPDTIALTGDENMLVRGLSTALCTIAASARMSAVVNEKLIGGVKITEDTRTIENISGGIVVFSCLDSRGYAASMLVENLMVPYSTPTANVMARRTDPTSGKVLLNVDGTFFQGSFGNQNNALTVKCRKNDGDPIDMPVQAEEGAYRAEIQLDGLDYRKSHAISVEVTDSLQTISRTVTIGKGIPIFDWGENDFRFNVPVTAPKINGVGKVLQNNFIVGGGDETLQEKTPKEVLSLINGASRTDLEEIEKKVKDIRMPTMVRLTASGTLYNDDTVTIANARGYTCYLIVVGTVGTSAAKVSAWLPGDMIPDSSEASYTWSIHEAINAKRFIAYFSGTSLLLTATGFTGNGVANETPAVYGLSIEGKEEGSQEI